MKKQEFLQQLRKNLSSLPETDISDILRDQEELIGDALASGRSEEQVIAAIGDPKSLAQTLVAQSRIESAENYTRFIPKARSTWGALVAVATIAPLSLLLLIPLVGIAFFLFFMWSTVFSLAVGFATSIFFFLTTANFKNVDVLTHLSTLLLILGMVGVLSLIVRFMTNISRGFLNQTLRYLKWNLKMYNKIGDDNV